MTAATRTRSRRKPGTGQALMLRRDFVASVEALKLDWQAYWASPGAGADGWGCPYVDKEAADLLTRGPKPGTMPRWYDPRSLEHWQDVGKARAAVQADRPTADDDHFDRQEKMIRALWKVPEPPMMGGCGEGDPGTSSVTPLLPTSPRLPQGERFDIPVSDTRGDGWDGHMAAFEQAHDEEDARTGNVRLLAPGEIPGPAPATRVDIIPSGPHRAHMEQS